MNTKNQNPSNQTKHQEQISLILKILKVFRYSSISILKGMGFSSRFLKTIEQRKFIVLLQNDTLSNDKIVRMGSAGTAKFEGINKSIYLRNFRFENAQTVYHQLGMQRALLFAIKSEEITFAEESIYNRIKEQTSLSPDAVLLDKNNNIIIFEFENSIKNSSQLYFLFGKYADALKYNVNQVWFFFSNQKILVHHTTKFKNLDWGLIEKKKLIGKTKYVRTMSKKRPTEELCNKFQFLMIGEVPCKMR